MGDMGGLAASPLGIKAAVLFNGDSGVLTVKLSFNIASVVRTATGKYTITFTEPMKSTQYLVLASNSGATGYNFTGIRIDDGTKTATRVNVGFTGVLGSTNTDADPHDTCVLVYDFS